MRHDRPAVPVLVGLVLAIGTIGCAAPGVPGVAPQRSIEPVAAGSAPGATHVAVASPSGAGGTGVQASPGLVPSPHTGPTASSTPATPPPTPPPPAPTRAARPPDAFTRRALQDAVDEYRTTERIPGISVSIVFPDSTTWTGVSGLADVAAKEPVATDTAFAVASISKTFLAALALELSAEGAFGLEEQVATYLPQLELDPAITVRMLLDHTSGLHDYFLSPRIDRALQSRPSVAWTSEQALGYVGKPYFAPGTGWHYSNTNYLVLGLLVEEVTGRPIAEELRRRYLEPLGLETAWYQAVEEPRADLARGYRLTGAGTKLKAVDLSDGTGVAPFRSVVTASGGAGSLAASSGDVARWARALYGGEAIDPESLSLMLSGVDRVAGYRPGVPYGLGVQALELDGHRTFGHSGRFLGFRAIMRWLPDEELAIAVLTNQSRVDPGPLAVRLLRIAIPEPGPVPAPLPY